jgi:hypothetical protein
VPKIILKESSNSSNTVVAEKVDESYSDFIVKCLNNRFCDEDAHKFFLKVPDEYKCDR